MKLVIELPVPRSAISWRETPSIVFRDVHSRTTRIARTLVAASIVAIFVTACAEEGDDDGDRRFANQPVTEVYPTSGPVETIEQPPTPSPRPSPAPAQLLQARGAPTVVYTLVEGRVVAADVSEASASRIFTIDSDFEPVDLASSPSGDRVAVLHVEGADGAGAAEVVMVSSEGEEFGRWAIAPGPDAALATPLPGVEGEPARLGAITWSADGTTLLAVLGTQRIVSMPLDGDAVDVPVPGNVSGVSEAIWSPAGDRLAVLAHDATGSGRIMTFDPEDSESPADQVVPPRADTAGVGSVTSFSWLPNGSGFAYILADEHEDLAPGGSLYVHIIETGERRLVATPGQGGPSALIVEFAVSPDGRSVAYVIANPMDETVVFHSLWVRSMREYGTYAVPVAGAGQVTDIWWTSEGVAWRQAEGDGPAALFIARRDGEIVGVASLEMSSHATPVSDELATPLAATPETVGTPDAATPVTAHATPITNAGPSDSTPASDVGMATPVAAATPAGTPLGEATPEFAMPVAATPVG